MAESRIIRLNLPFPPSVNTMWRRGARSTYLSKTGRRYRKEAIAACQAQYQRPALTQRLRVTLDLHRGDRRNYDIDNCVKAVLDSLQHGGVIADDNQVDHLVVRRRGIRKPGEVAISLRIATP